MQIDFALVQAVVDQVILVLAEDAIGGIAVQHLNAAFFDKLLDGLTLSPLFAGERLILAARGQGQHSRHQQRHAHENLYSHLV